MTQVTLADAKAKVTKTEADKVSSITGYWDTISGVTKKTCEAKKDKDDSALK